MRNGQNNNNKRMRNNNNSNNNNRNNNNNNNHRRSQNPMTRVFDSNGPDIKIRGTASHVAEKYVQLARDARSSGDPVAAENYYQHAEHYFRLIAAAQEQFRQNQQQPRIDNANNETSDSSDEGESDGYSNFGAEPGFVNQPQQQPQPQQQSFPPREPRAEQSYQPRDNRDQNRDQNREHHRPQPQHQPQPVIQPSESSGDVDRLPSFITGGAQPNGNSFEANGQPGERTERFPRRRRRPGPRPEGSAPQPASDDFNRGD